MGKTVLIVDDHPSFRASVRRMLEAHGYDVVGEAKDGGAALLANGELRPQIVLLDVRLPDVDGFEVAKALIGCTGPAPLVVLTSSHDYADLSEAIATSGARGFISKEELTGTALAAMVG
jgi:DNA-binding NarL/FixJ family response regulator